MARLNYCLDVDGDGYGEGCTARPDNCLNDYNPRQLDADGNGIGDVCDPGPWCGGCGQGACEAVSL